jgi:hypothetical protein
VGHRRLELRANGLRDGKAVHQGPSTSINVAGCALGEGTGLDLIPAARQKGAPEFALLRGACDAALGAYLGVLAGGFAARLLGQSASG